MENKLSMEKDIQTEINEHGNTKTPYDDKRAKIIGSHPWRGSVAECLGARKMGGRWYMIMRDIETYNEFGVMNGSELMWID